MADAPEPFLAEDFKLVVDRLTNADTRLRGILLSEHLEIILAALRLAPVGVAAIAYIRNFEDGTFAMSETWEVLERAIENYRESQQ